MQIVEHEARHSSSAYVASLNMLETHSYAYWLFLLL